MSSPKLYFSEVFIIAFAERSIVKSRPEWTISFSEAPAIRFSKATDGTIGIGPAVASNVFSYASLIVSAENNMFIKN